MSTLPLDHPLLFSRRQSLRMLLTEIRLAAEDAQANPADAEDYLACIRELAAGGAAFLDAPLPNYNPPEGERFIRWKPGASCDLRCLEPGEFARPYPELGMWAICAKIEEARR